MTQELNKLLQNTTFEYNKQIDEDCLGCKFEGLCKAPGVWTETCPIDGFNTEKDTILLIDDNTSIIEFLKEDIKCLQNADVISKENFNTIAFTESRCAFQFYSVQQKMQGLNIKYAIIDLEYNGTIIKDDELIKMTGVDVFESILEYNPQVQVLFYTNILNDDIKRHKLMIEHYHNLTGKNIHDVILNKSFEGVSKRRVNIAKDLFNTEVSCSECSV